MSYRQEHMLLYCRIAGVVTEWYLWHCYFLLILVNVVNRCPHHTYFFKACCTILLAVVWGICNDLELTMYCECFRYEPSSQSSPLWLKLSICINIFLDTRIFTDRWFGHDCLGQCRDWVHPVFRQLSNQNSIQHLGGFEHWRDVRITRTSRMCSILTMSANYDLAETLLSKLGCAIEHSTFSSYT